MNSSTTEGFRCAFALLPREIQELARKNCRFWRLTWKADTGKLLVERQEFRGATFLERMHRRRGYQQPYALEDTWSFSVDLAVVAMVFWSLSGLWLWWELRSTRFWGTTCAVLGLLLFGLFLALL